MRGIGVEASAQSPDPDAQGRMRRLTGQGVLGQLDPQWPLSLPLSQLRASKAGMLHHLLAIMKDWVTMSSWTLLEERSGS